MAGSLSRLKRHLEREVDTIAAGEEKSSSRRNHDLSLGIFGLPDYSPRSLLSSFEQGGRGEVTPASETMTGRNLLEVLDLTAAEEEEEGAISVCGSSSAVARVIKESEKEVVVEGIEGSSEGKEEAVVHGGKEEAVVQEVEESSQVKEAVVESPGGRGRRWFGGLMVMVMVLVFLLLQIEEQGGD